MTKPKGPRGPYDTHSGHLLTQSATAKILGISQQRVDQYERRALAKLRRSRVLQQLARDLGLIP